MQVGYSIEQVLTQGSQAMEPCAFVDSPKLEAEILLAHLLDKDRTYLYTWPEKIVDNDVVVQFRNLCRERMLGKPIAHLIGEREFWGLSLKVTPDTLIPRPDTETLVETALQLLADKPQAEIADLGTGTGAIALALKSELPHATISAVDFSEAALAVAKNNSETLNLPITCLHGSWCEPLAGKQFDLIASNPPYIEEQDPHLEQGDVRFEPITALTSGADGLDDIRLISEQAKAHLKAAGWLLIEHGYNQAQAVQEILRQDGYINIESRQDYGTNDRITFGQMPSSK
ncbi:peptide chain release factor N(5)-glutamine methyltransferase [Thiomicrorhabdus sp. 6S2-11]|uniref:Release factor glutamine methyltransferase n=1 Tax=Thiomicrorhabdus marina TaxID=2818442 RepID=A0ABS3Q442_9GAMM|nr:peptide chain release factor N(5)-glutamine methyltransferase [Thiomicrorhabdus marina]MBO1927103.1 peptide chain release factor N(5)-glutamine methyltransferase [Thiomicrorhabdus marina]